MVLFYLSSLHDLKTAIWWYFWADLIYYCVWVFISDWHLVYRNKCIEVFLGPLHSRTVVTACWWRLSFTTIKWNEENILSRMLSFYARQLQTSVLCPIDQQSRQGKTRFYTSLLLAVVRRVQGISLIRLGRIGVLTKVWPWRSKEYSLRKWVIKTK